jgi:hypothetical protein
LVVGWSSRVRVAGVQNLDPFALIPAIGNAWQRSAKRDSSQLIDALIADKV